MMMRFDAAPDELAVFLEEAEEQLQLLDQDILVLEKTGSNPDLLQEAFRAAHTLKGSSAAIGHERMAALTHAMESVLDCLRKGKVGVTTELANLLLQSLDALRVLKEEVATLRNSGLDPASLVVSFEQLLHDHRPDPGNGPMQGAGKPVASAFEFAVRGHNAEGPVYRITVTTADDAMFSAARLLQARMALSETGVVLQTVPSEEELDAGLTASQLTVLCITSEDKDRLRDLLLAIPDIATVEIEDKVDGGDLFVPNGDWSDGDSRDGDSRVDLATENGVAPPIASGPAENGGGNGRSLGEGQGTTRWASKTARIDIERLDTLMNLVGELVIDCTRLVQYSARLQSLYEGEETAQGLCETSLHIERIADELQDRIMKTRMLPISSVFNRFPRMVRDMAQRVEKKVDCVIEGEETELDRSVIEEIGDPLIHLLRNAIDHGIETPPERIAQGKPELGLVRLSACHRENRIVLTVEDDGKGIDPVRVREAAVQKGILSPETANRLSDREALEVIFVPGFSTAREVSNLSGRGVGTDIVATNVHKLNGAVRVDSTLGFGTRFTLELPLTLAIMEALLVSQGNNIFAIPLASVMETLRLRSVELKSINNEKVVQLRGQVLPLLPLDTLAARRESTSVNWSGKDKAYVVVVGTENDKVGIVVDSLVGEQQVVIKSLGKYIGDVRGISGATILGDGRVALILDVGALVKKRLQERAVDLIYA